DAWLCVARDWAGVPRLCHRGCLRWTEHFFLGRSRGWWFRIRSGGSQFLRRCSCPSGRVAQLKRTLPESWQPAQESSSLDGRHFSNYLMSSLEDCTTVVEHNACIGDD